MGRVHTEAVRRLGSTEPIAIGGRDEAAFRAALANPGIKAVHICTPNAAHFPMAKAALEAGKHVLCEKPLATSVRDATELVELARGRKCRNCTCHKLEMSCTPECNCEHDIDYCANPWSWDVDNA